MEPKWQDSFFVDSRQQCQHTTWEYRGVYMYIRFYSPFNPFKKSEEWGWLDLLFKFEDWPFETPYLDNAMAYCDYDYGCPVFSPEQGDIMEQMVKFIDYYKEKSQQVDTIFDVWKNEVKVDKI